MADRSVALSGRRPAALGVLLAGSLVVSAALAADEGGARSEMTQEEWEEHPYIARNGEVDFGTYNGYRRYHSYCHTCHGPDGLGSSYAPALLESMKQLSYPAFLEVVVNGRENVSQAQWSVMPGFGDTPDVMLYVDDIYAYLKARADGAVGRGRPSRLPPEKDPVWQERRED